MIADTSHRGQSFILLGCSNRFFIKREASFLFLRRAFGGGTEKSQLSPTAANQPKKHSRLQLTDPVIISYMSAPRLHQSTALLWPDLVRISGALQENRQTQSEGVNVFVMGYKAEASESVTFRCVCYPHVLDGAAEGVCDGSIVNRFFAEPKVSQLDVSLNRKPNWSTQMRHKRLPEVQLHPV